MKFQSFSTAARKNVHTELDTFLCIVVDTLTWLKNTVNITFLSKRAKHIVLSWSAPPTHMRTKARNKIEIAAV